MWIAFGMPLTLASQITEPDTVSIMEEQTGRYNSFYDSLRARAQQKKITKWMHGMLFRNPKSGITQKDTIDPLLPFGGKVINQVRIKRLDVFGPSLRDTSRKATIWYEKAGNLIHTRSDLHNLRKNLLFKTGEPLETNEIYENERILRALPYIRDARFYVEIDSLDSEKVNITLLTQDRFSIGITGDVQGINSAALEVYNRNIFGVGHEFSTRLVGHLIKEPYMGIEAFYKVNNLNGKFISLSAGYMNTYLNEGVSALMDKPFLRVSDKWGYGISGYYFKRSYQLPGEQFNKRNVQTGFRQAGGWAGRNFQIKGDKGASQVTFSGQYTYRTFTSRPEPAPGKEQFYYNHSTLLAGITWSQRTFHPDELIFGYGITEDIPKGFKNEMVFGYDIRESGNRWYGHLFFANGNLLREKQGYLYASAGADGFYNSGGLSQGMVEFCSRYISALSGSGKARFRHFFNLDYKLGINRFEEEILMFEKNNLIRGFGSRVVTGQQRLSLNLESVYFHYRDFYRFNLAFFAFADLGLIGPEDSNIFKGDYYSGFGIGLRVHNESLVFKTLQIRISFYPNHPRDVGLAGFLLNEHTRQGFYSFQPQPPAPFRFE